MMTIIKVTSKHAMAYETEKIKYFKTMEKAEQWIEERTQKWTDTSAITGKTFTYETHTTEIIEVED